MCPVANLKLIGMFCDFIWQVTLCSFGISFYSVAFSVCTCRTDEQTMAAFYVH